MEPRLHSIRLVHPFRRAFHFSQIGEEVGETLTAERDKKPTVVDDVVGETLSVIRASVESRHRTYTVNTRFTLLPFCR